MAKDFYILDKLEDVECPHCHQIVEVKYAGDAEPGWGNLLWHSMRFQRAMCNGTGQAVKLEKDQSRLI